MSDNPNAPAAAGGDYYTADAAEAAIAALEQQEPDGEAEATPEAPNAPVDEQPSQDDETAAADESSEETASDEDAEETPADDAEETDTETDAEEEKFAHGNMKTRLRDGSVTTVGALKPLAEEAIESRAKISELTAAQQQLQKQFEEREAQIAYQEQLYGQVTPLAAQYLLSQIPPKPDPSMLDYNSPNFNEDEYYRQHHLRQIKIEEFQALQDTLRGGMAQQQKQMEDAREAQLQALREQNRKAINEKIPEFADKAKSDAAYNRIVDFVKQYGMTKEDVGDIANHDSKLVHMIYDAARVRAAYDKMMSQKKVADVKSKAAVPVQKPGPRVSQADAAQRQFNEQFQRWRANGATADGAEALIALLERGS